MFRILIEEREIIKIMCSDGMKFSGKYFRSRDYAAFLSMSQDALMENKITHDLLVNQCDRISFLVPHPMHI